MTDESINNNLESSDTPKITVPLKGQDSTNTIKKNIAVYSSDGEYDLPLSAVRRYSSDSEYDVPLSMLRKKYLLGNRRNENNCSTLTLESSNVEDDPHSQVELLDHEDPDYYPTCEASGCKKEVWSSCHKCLILLCWDHFINDSPCEVHNRSFAERACRIVQTPEYFTVEGEEKIEHSNKQKVNRKKEASIKRNSGQAYESYSTKKYVAAKELKPGCKSEFCRKSGKKCQMFTEELRRKIFTDFQALGNIQLKREYICRCVEENTKKRKTTENASRRTKTKAYYLFLNGKREIVCKFFFLNTLGASEKAMRTAVSKMTSTGAISKDFRGGRKQSLKIRDSTLRQQVQEHINRFPRAESHYCRKNTSREYLHSELSLPKMYLMFKEECGRNNQEVACYTLYSQVFKEMKLSFNRPKKDQCSLCNSFLRGSDQEKLELADRYDLHIKEKRAVRLLKTKYKQEAIDDPSILCASFDLQQVIHVPISNDNAVFYKRRLGVFNLTMYNIASKECSCFTWHEGQGKRGSCEIASSLYSFLKSYDDRGKEKAYLFADSCSGQNKNSVVASTLFYTLQNSKNLKEISLRFFTPNHGQNEGDSAHSVISRAINKAGDIMVPSQLNPVFRLARRQQPYRVHNLEFSDFLDFKTFAKNLRILNIRNDDSQKEFKWTEMVEFTVKKDHLTKLFFKTTHLDPEYRTLTLKRQAESVLISNNVPKLYNNPPPIPSAKYDDLMSLCAGPTRLIRLPEEVEFYRSLAH